LERSTSAKDGISILARLADGGLSKTPYKNSQVTEIQFKSATTYFAQSAQARRKRPAQAGASKTKNMFFNQKQKMFKIKGFGNRSKRATILQFCQSNY
jgi:hypothetical protein